MIRIEETFTILKEKGIKIYENVLYLSIEDLINNKKDFDIEYDYLNPKWKMLYIRNNKTNEIVGVFKKGRSKYFVSCYYKELE